MTMGERLKQLREQKKLTQEEVGAIIGVNKAAIQKYESGKVENIKRSNIKKLADFFNVTPTYLMGWDDAKKETPILSEQDKRLVDMFDMLDEAGKDHMLKFMQALLDSQDDS